MTTKNNEKQDIVLAYSNWYIQVFVDGQSVLKEEMVTLPQLLVALGVPFRTIWYTNTEIDAGKAYPETISDDEVRRRLTTRFDEQGKLRR